MGCLPNVFRDERMLEGKSLVGFARESVTPREWKAALATIRQEVCRPGGRLAGYRRRLRPPRIFSTPKQTGKETMTLPRAFNATKPGTRGSSSRRRLLALRKRSSPTAPGSGGRRLPILRMAPARSRYIVEIAFALDCSPYWLAMGFGAAYAMREGRHVRPRAHLTRGPPPRPPSGSGRRRIFQSAAFAEGSRAMVDEECWRYSERIVAVAAVYLIVMGGSPSALWQAMKR